jgi:hypothetical protein
MGANGRESIAGLSSPLSSAPGPSTSVVVLHCEIVILTIGVPGS